jgi:hypothetical protein
MASDCDQTWCSARPRPFSSNRTARTPSSSSASSAATRGVSSTLALSAMVIRTWYGKFSLR